VIINSAIVNYDDISRYRCVMFKRSVNITELLKKNSYFLFGPRGTGKSFLIRNTLENYSYINLLESRIYLALKNDPDHLESLIDQKLVVVDEIQRVPELLNVVHRLIEERQILFLLTGSSARKLKRGGANLLAGRAYSASLFPFTWFEIANHQTFSLERYLKHGGLPKAYIEDDPWDFLFSYVDTYLKEEIQAEALSRNLPNFSRFLSQAAIRSSELLNYTKVGCDAQISPNTARDYYQILEDTLIGYQLEPWTLSEKRKAIQTSKFYLFDTGVTNALRNITTIPDGTDYFGRAFEQFLCNELKAYISYRRIREPLKFWRSTSKYEVDFILENKVAIEVKAAKKTSARDHSGLKAIAEEPVQWQRKLLISRDPQSQLYTNGIEHMHWQVFLQKLWANEFS